MHNALLALPVIYFGLSGRGGAHCLALPRRAFGLLSSVMDRFIIKYNSYGYLVKKTFFVLVKKTFFVLLICLVSSAVLVPLYGLTGVAFSVILTKLLSFTLLNYFFAAQPMLTIHRSFSVLKNMVLIKRRQNPQIVKRN